MLAWVCRLVVALWIGSYLAWSVAPTPLEPAVRELARVLPLRPIVEPAGEPAATAATPSPTPLAAADLAAGEPLLDASGSFPVLDARYDDFPSFRAYASAMGALGARFVVVRERRIVGGVDLDTGAAVAVPELSGFSPRARDYTAEPAVAVAARAAREAFGSDAEVMMLVPRGLDAALFGGIARVLAARGDAHQGYREIRVRYLRAPGGGVRLRVESGTRRDGSEVSLDLLFDLGEVARLGAAATRSAA